MTNPQENRNMLNWRARIAALVLAMVAPVMAAAQNAIQSITTTQQAGAEVVRIEMAQPLTEVPKGFVVQSPARVVVDLQGASNAIGRSSVEINQGNLRSVNIAQAGERTRLVLNLKQPANYRAELQGNALLVVLEATAAPGAQAAAGEAVQFAASQNRDQLPVRDIDFRRRGCDAGQYPGRRRHSPAGPEPGGRVPALVSARRAAQALGRH
jgi:type IV pilus assembly protein PilQ